MIDKRALLVFLALLCLLGACGGGDTPKDEGGGNLVVGIVGAPYSTANWLSNDLNVSIMMSAINPRLLSIAKDGSKELVILKEATMSDDLKTATWIIHEGLNWHDGVPFTVEDIGFSFDYQYKHSLGHGASYYSNIDSWTSHGAYEIEINLKEPQANFTTQAGYWPIIMPKHIYENVEDPNHFDYPGLGYGPYRLVEKVDGQYYYAEKVENWPLANGGAGANIDSITFRVYEDANSMTLALLNGEIDATGTYVNSSCQSQIAANPDLDLFTAFSLGYAYIGMNSANTLLADLQLRTAIAMCIDRAALVNIAKSHGAMQMRTPVSPVYPDLVRSNITYPGFDAKLANKLLDEAGYTLPAGKHVREKDGKPLSFVLSCRNSTQDVDSCASVLKANFEAIGIELTIEILESSAYIDKVTKERKFDINFIEWGTIDDPDSNLSIYTTNSHVNFFGYSNPVVDEIIAKTMVEPDYEARKILLDEFQREFVKDCHIINLFVPMYGWGASKKFTGWAASPGYYGLVELKNLVNVRLAE
ncbi:MAG: ABC transporter substrate-binding protein [Eubacteriaceae bacterium]|nr:ABC transporter substrate-binding protein [Eubacteriaceae bacterium]